MYPITVFFLLFIYISSVESLEQKESIAKGEAYINDRNPGISYSYDSIFLVTKFFSKFQRCDGINDSLANCLLIILPWKPSSSFFGFILSLSSLLCISWLFIL